MVSIQQIKTMQAHTCLVKIQSELHCPVSCFVNKDMFFCCRSYRLRLGAAIFVFIYIYLVASNQFSSHKVATFVFVFFSVICLFFRSLWRLYPSCYLYLCDSYSVVLLLVAFCLASHVLNLNFVESKNIRI